MLVAMVQLNRTGFPGGDVVWFLRRQGGVLQVVVVTGFDDGSRIDDQRG